VTAQFDLRNSAFGISPAHRLAVMNLALRGIEADFGKEHADTFRRDRHPLGQSNGWLAGDRTWKPILTSPITKTPNFLE